MSLLNKASLIQIPSGYKDGTLYSAKPTNGDGDFTFSRGSNLAATRVNSDGLIEKGRENLLLQSNSFDTTWVNVNTSETGGQSGYDGSSDAWLITLTGGTATKLITQTTSTLSGVYTASFYAKAGTHSIVQIGTSNQSNIFVCFDLSDGSVGSLSANAINAKATSISNGWYRIEVAFLGTNANGISIAGVDSISATRFQSTSSTGNFYIQDSQLESGLVATDYIETGASTAQAGILEDMPRLDYSGGATCGHLLLEAQRSNILSHSEYLPIGMSFARSTFTNNDAISPEGLKNATKWQMTSDTGAHYLRKGFTTSDTYSVSIFAKKGNYRYLGLRSGSTLIGFDFDTETFVGGTGTKEAFGDGWWRLSVTATGSGFSYFGIHYSNSSGGEQTTADGTEYYHIYGMQIELGSYPTSYIPTYGASVTRGVDIVDGAVDSNLFNDDEGVLFVEFAALADTRDNDFRFLICDGTNNERIQIFLPTSNILNVDCIVSNSATANITYTLPNPSSNHKVAFKYKNNDFALWVDGVERGTDTSGATPSGLDRLDFYRTPNNNNYIEANVKQTIYFNTALTDDELATLTTL